MLGAVLGDMIGSPYEFDTYNVKTKDFPLFSEESRFTDDTVMTCAVARALLQARKRKPEEWAALLTVSMQELGRAYPNAGYGGRFAQWLQSENPRPSQSWGNGSAMRVSPAGWMFATMEETLRAAECTAAVTHNHPEGIKGAKALAAAMFLARGGAPKLEIARYVTDHFGYDLRRSLDEIRPDYSMDVSCGGSVPVAIRAFLEGRGFEDTLRLAVSVGGDSDTIACMAGALAECRYSIPEAILREGLRRLDGPLAVICRDFLTYMRSEGRRPRESWQSLVNPPEEKSGAGKIEDALNILHEAADPLDNRNRVPAVQIIADAIKRNDDMLSAFQLDSETVKEIFGTDDLSLIAETAQRGRVQALKKQVPVKFLTIKDANGVTWLPVYTGKTELDKGGAVSGMHRPLGTMAREVRRREETAGLAINPFGHGLNLKNELLNRLPLLKSTSIMVPAKGSCLLPVDGCVLAADKDLKGSSAGISALPKDKAEKLAEECRGLHGCREGEAVRTLSHGLPCRYLLHTAPPLHGNREGEELLADCYRSCLELALSGGMQSLAFPPLGSLTGAFSPKKAAELAVKAVGEWLKAHGDRVFYVYFCCEKEEDRVAYEAILRPAL
ncbi:MAG: ADP-ribosylglycohydrolase family protein [Oscillospiraceae bacterium]|nr:ADP-ribosylglycohydrolase family protein [Oscillospiraceae bacterium]